MSIASFMKLVEIQTKLASVLPFSLGTIYALYHFKRFDLGNFVLMFIPLITFDMATTAINNYIDYKKAIKKDGYGYEHHNAIVRDDLSEFSVLLVIFILVGIALVAGGLLALRTNVIILLLWGVSFLVGMCYSFGPIPISRMPLGEIFSGLFMGFVIPFLSVYIHVFDQNILTIVVNSPTLILHIDIVEILYIFLASLPTIIGIANIMLANNICDMEEDVENKRYTLPIYIGRESSLKLFIWLYVLLYLDLILLIILKIEPIISLITLGTVLPVKRNVKRFLRQQTKKETFSLAVHNFMLINFIRIVILSIAKTINL